MAAITAERVREAAEILGIQDLASLNEIRIRYYERIKEWHPDVSRRNPAVSHEMTIRLKKAYDLLVDYCMNYTFPFPIGEPCKGPGTDPRRLLDEWFGDDPIWR